MTYFANTKFKTEENVSQGTKPKKLKPIQMKIIET